VLLLNNAMSLITAAISHNTDKGKGLIEERSKCQCPRLSWWDDLAGLAILAGDTYDHSGSPETEGQQPIFLCRQGETVAPALGLRVDVDIAQLDPFTVPIAVLPPLLHRDLMKNALRWMDVYQEPSSHK